MLSRRRPVPGCSTTIPSKRITGRSARPDPAETPKRRARSPSWIAGAWFDSRSSAASACRPFSEALASCARAGPPSQHGDQADAGPRRGDRVRAWSPGGHGARPGRPAPRRRSSAAFIPHGPGCRPGFSGPTGPGPSSPLSDGQRHWEIALDGLRRARPFTSTHKAPDPQAGRGASRPAAGRSRPSRSTIRAAAAPSTAGASTASSPTHRTGLQGLERFRCRARFSRLLVICPGVGMPTTL